MPRLASAPRTFPALGPYTVEETSLQPDALPALIPETGECAFLDSALPGSPWSRHSVLGLEPKAVFSFCAGRLRIKSGAWTHRESCGDPFALVDRIEAMLPEPESSRGPAPGWTGFPTAPLALGYLSYDLGRYVERVPSLAADDIGLPQLRLALYDKLLVADHAEGRVRAVSLLGEEGWWRDLRPADSAFAERAPTERAPAWTAAGRPRSGFTRDAYEAAVRRCLDYIAAGDVYQLNLSQRFVCEGSGSLAGLYRRLRAANPAPYAAYLAWGQGAILSSSPELFLERDGELARTRPIKGTRRRDAVPEADRMAARDLLASAKDRAELAMIVDLERNDLGKVAVLGGVRVAAERELETYASVHHTVAAVEARLRPGVTAGELLRAAFPGGSITGVPKRRAMEIIEELEPVRRGPYTGCVGWLEGGGRMAWNIAIRTLVATAGRVSFHVGGGIVADSDPAAEYEETLAKAERLFAAVRGN